MLRLSIQNLGFLHEHVAGPTPTTWKVELLRFVESSFEPTRPCLALVAFVLLLWPQFVLVLLHELSVHEHASEG